MTRAQQLGLVILLLGFIVYVVVFVMQQAVIAIDQSHFAAEAAHCLGQLQTNVAAADYEKMFGYLIQFKCFDMC